MGRFIYAGSPSDSYRIADRVMAHLEVAIGAKFRLGDSFAFTLDGDHVPSGRGYRVLWMHPAIPIQFRYDADHSRIPINAAWVAAMVASAASEGGLQIVPEPEGGAGPAKGRPPIYG